MTRDGSATPGRSPEADGHPCPTEAGMGRFDPPSRAPGRAWYSEPPTNLRPEFHDLPPVSEREWAYIKETARQRAEAVSVVDESIGRIMHALQQSGEARANHRRVHLGQRILPLSASHPPRQVIAHLLSHRAGAAPHSWSRIPCRPGAARPLLSVDHAPTLVRAAGVTPPYATDGRSMLAVARQGDTGWRRAVLTETPPAPDASRGPVLGIRTGRYFYTNWRNGAEELFDMSSDRMERHNVATRPEYLSELQLLRETLQQMRACRGDACNAPLPEGLAPPG